MVFYLATSHFGCGSSSASNVGSADLSGIDLSGADLEDAQLACINLSSANLSKINLARAKYFGFDPSSTNLSDALCTETDYSNDPIIGA